MQRIGVIGAGAWGTALAALLAAAGRNVVLWSRNEAVVSDINTIHENPLYLAGVDLPESLAAGTDGAVLANRELILLVTPAQYLGEITATLAPYIGADVPLIISAKGIERESLRLMAEVVADSLPGRPLAVLSGPTFAIEVARGLPTAVTLACAEADLGEALAETIGQPHFRPYFTDDVVGAEIGGAIKNVIAIACGIVTGRKLGENARAALMTRGLAEMLRFGRTKGAKAETLMGLSGLGDLVLTCNSPQSRNMSLGIALGEGQSMDDVLAGRRTVAEGVATAAAIAGAGEALGLDLPISTAVDRICNQGADIDEEIRGLMARPFIAETA